MKISLKIQFHPKFVNLSVYRFHNILTFPSSLNLATIKPWKDIFRATSGLFFFLGSCKAHRRREHVLLASSLSWQFDSSELDRLNIPMYLTKNISPFWAKDFNAVDSARTKKKDFEQQHTLSKQDLNEEGSFLVTVEYSHFASLSKSKHTELIGE